MFGSSALRARWGWLGSSSIKRNKVPFQNANRMGEHAIVLLDSGGWHTTAKPEIPDNLSLLFLPPASPELNSAENVWQYLRQTYLGNRVFDGYEAIVQRLCQAWRAPLGEPGRIASITHRDWACVDQYLFPNSRTAHQTTFHWRQRLLCCVT